MLCSIFNKLLCSCFISGFFYTGIGIMVLAGGCNSSPQTASEFFNGTSLEGWSASDSSYWSVQDDAIVGHSAHEVKRNEFLWSNVEVTDFYRRCWCSCTAIAGRHHQQLMCRKLFEYGDGLCFLSNPERALN